MTLLLISWVLAMISGLVWAQGITAFCTAVTAIAWLMARIHALGDWTVWLELGGLLAGPWLLAAWQRRDERILKRWHAQEAERMAQISESARSLLSLQTSGQQLESQIAEITDVYHVTKATARTLHFSELFAKLIDVAPTMMRAAGVRLVDLSVTERAPHAARAVRRPDGRLEPAGESGILPLEHAVVDRAKASGRPGTIEATQLPSPRSEAITRIAWAPLWRKQQMIGVLMAEDLPEAQMKTLAIIANQLSLQLSRIHLYQRVEAMAVTDSLTGLYVRNHFLDRAREELARSKRHGLPCTLLMVDLDRFKEKNDTYGHLVGDVVLREVARLLQRNLRDVDLMARFGGEEFIMLLIETTAEQALPILQRLRQLVEVHPIRAYDELLHQTISVGLTVFPEDGQTFDTLIEQADQALYEAKRTGRNNVVRWSKQLQKAVHTP